MCVVKLDSGNVLQENLPSRRQFIYVYIGILTGLSSQLPVNGAFPGAYILFNPTCNVDTPYGAINSAGIAMVYLCSLVIVLQASQPLSCLRYTRSCRSTNQTSSFVSFMRNPAHQSKEVSGFQLLSSTQPWM